MELIGYRHSSKTNDDIDGSISQDEIDLVCSQEDAEPILMFNWLVILGAIVNSKLVNNQSYQELFSGCRVIIHFF